MNKPVDLECSRLCACAAGEESLAERSGGLWPRLVRWRSRQLARRALQRAGDPGLVLDLPCGNGSFWPLLAEKANRVIIAADHALSSIEAARARQPEALARRVKPLQILPLAIELTDNAVDSIFCMRLLHQLGASRERRSLLREFHRVTRDSLVVSLWVDGNLESWRHQRRERRQATQREERCVIPRAQIEGEFAAAGFRIDAHYDFLPAYAMLRVYVLRKA